MANEEPLIEQREHRRFPAPEGAFAFFGSRSAKLGQIIDISTGGLAFHYVTDSERPYHSLTLDILLPNGTFYLDALPFKTISDYRIKNETGLDAATRRCGIQFGKLSDEQLTRLRRFIHTYVTSYEDPS